MPGYSTIQPGTAQSEDLLIYKDETHPDWGFGLGVTEDEQYMYLTVTESTSGNALAFRKAGLEDLPFTWLDKEFENDYQVIGNKDNMLFVLTNFDAPHYRLIGIDLEPSRPGALGGCSSGT